MNVVVSGRVIDRRMQPLENAASNEPLIVVFANIAAHDDCVWMARIHHVNGTAQIVKGVRRFRLAHVYITDLGDGYLRLPVQRETQQQAQRKNTKSKLKKRS